MRLIVGLGNPGTKYKDNRHNIGFMAVDAIVRRHNFSDFSSKFKSLVAQGEIAGEKVLIIKPQTFMNLSGEAVQAAAAFYKIEPNDVIVFHDEMDLPEGKLRVKLGGGSGGHNGLKSIDAHIGADYWRVRLGIDRPVNPDMVTFHVLGDFLKEDYLWIEKLLDVVSSNVDKLVKGETDTFASKVALEMRV